jgi:hypothetical protein
MKRLAPALLVPTAMLAASTAFSACGSSGPAGAPPAGKDSGTLVDADSGKAPADSGGHGDAVPGGDASHDAPASHDGGDAGPARRPSYNTGTGFFVLNGKIYDANGVEFRIRGVDRCHYDSNSAAGMANSHANTVRIFVETNYGQTWSGLESIVQNDHINHSEVPIVTAPSTTSGTATSGDTTFATLNDVVANSWVAPAATWTAIDKYMIVNIANEWGPADSVDWQTAYAAVIQGVSGISGSTVTIKSSSAANPFAGQTQGYIAGAGGLTDQIVSITGTGGSSGAWTVTLAASPGSGYTTGGTLNAGAIGILRAAGYLAPLLIDAGGSGQDEADLATYSGAVFDSDPQKNIVFAYHAYGSVNPYSSGIMSIAKGSPTVITLNSSSSTHPFAPTYDGSNNSYSGISAYEISGVMGMTEVNGEQPAPQNVGGSPGAWTVTLSVDSTSWGTYSGGGTMVDYNGNYALKIARIAALGAKTGAAYVVPEFGPGRNIGPSPTTVTPDQIVSTAEMNNIGWAGWAWDDNDLAASQADNDSFSMTYNVGAYTTSPDLTIYGQQIVEGCTNAAPGGCGCPDTPAPAMTVVEPGCKGTAAPTYSGLGLKSLAVPATIF